MSRKVLNSWTLVTVALICCSSPWALAQRTMRGVSEDPSRTQTYTSEFNLGFRVESSTRKGLPDTLRQWLDNCSDTFSRLSAAADGGAIYSIRVDRMDIIVKSERAIPLPRSASGDLRFILSYGTTCLASAKFEMLLLDAGRRVMSRDSLSLDVAGSGKEASLSFKGLPEARYAFVRISALGKDELEVSDLQTLSLKNLSIEIEGKDIGSASPFKGIEIPRLLCSVSFGEYLSSRGIAALGAAVKGSANIDGETYRHVRQGVSECGVTLVALDLPVFQGFWVEDYVQGTLDIPRGRIASMFSERQYDGKAFADLILWLREWNAGRESKVHVSGYSVCFEANEISRDLRGYLIMLNRSLKSAAISDLISRTGQSPEEPAAVVARECAPLLADGNPELKADLGSKFEVLKSYVDDLLAEEGNFDRYAPSRCRYDPTRKAFALLSMAISEYCGGGGRAIIAGHFSNLNLLFDGDPDHASLGSLLRSEYGGAYGCVLLAAGLDKLHSRNSLKAALSRGKEAGQVIAPTSLPDAVLCRILPVSASSRSCYLDWFCPRTQTDGVMFIK